jgi:hypothetical protein
MLERSKSRRSREALAAIAPLLHHVPACPIEVIHLQPYNGSIEIQINEAYECSPFLDPLVRPLTWAAGAQ